MSRASEERADGWQRDTADRNRTITQLAAELRAERDRTSEAVRAAVAAERERIASLANQWGAAYVLANDAGNPYDVKSFADLIRKEAPDDPR